MFEFWISISVKFVPTGPLNNKSALVRVMSGGAKPLLERMIS